MMLMGIVGRAKIPVELPTSGLVAQYDSSSGVVRSGNTVSQWNDISGTGNDLNDVLDDSPTYISNSINGQPSVYFNGASSLSRKLKTNPTQVLYDLPQGNTDRTAVLVCRYISGYYGGFTYGPSNAPGNSFRMFPGLGNGKLMFSTSEGQNGVNTGVQANGAGWLVHSVKHQSSVTTHYKNNSLIQTINSSLNTGNFRITLAGDVDTSPRVEMYIAMALLYDRALSSSEMNQLHDYIEEVYGIS